MRSEALVIGASHGGFDLLLQILPALKSPLPVMICLHLPRGAGVDLARHLDSHCAYPVREAQDKDSLQPQTAYLAPGGYHLLVEADRSLSLSADGPVNFAQPAIDVLFESAAAAYGNRLIGVLLSGASADGARGLAAIAEVGGRCIVQDPATARASVMPAAALQLMEPEAVLPPDEIADSLNLWMCET